MIPGEEIAAARLARAREAFRDGTILLQNGSWNAAVNRFYYCSFHAARALLATKDRDAKSHAAVIAIFHEEFVRNGPFGRDCARALTRGFEKRQRSDYFDLVESTREDAEAARNDAAEFLSECERLL